MRISVELIILNKSIHSFIIIPLLHMSVTLIAAPLSYPFDFLVRKEHAETEPKLVSGLSSSGACLARHRWAAAVPHSIPIETLTSLYMMLYF